MKRKTIKKLKKNKRKTVKNKVKYGGSNNENNGSPNQKRQRCNGYNSNTTVIYNNSESESESYVIPEYKSKSVSNYLNEDTIFLFLPLHGTINCNLSFSKFTSDYDVPKKKINQFNVFNKVTLGNLGCGNMFDDNDDNIIKKYLNNNYNKNINFLDLCRDALKETDVRNNRIQTHETVPISQKYPHRLYDKDYKDINLINKQFSYNPKIDGNMQAIVIYNGKTDKPFILQDHLIPTDGQYMFDTNQLMDILLEQGYKNVFIYDTSCNTSRATNTQIAQNLNRKGARM